MMINKITPSVDYNYMLKSLDTINLEPTNQSSTRVFEPLNKRACSKTLGASEIYSPITPPSLTKWSLLVRLCKV